MTTHETRPPTVFISYSHDSQELADRVLALSGHLRADGIDCILDQYEDSPPEGFPRWMDRQIRDADFVLMICTPTYYRRVMGEEEPGKGHGVAFESTLIYQYIYNEGTSNTRFIPVLLEGGDASDISIPWQGVKKYHPATKEGFEELYRRLTEQPLILKPALGTRRTLPPRERTHDFVVQIVDVRPPEVINNVPYARNPYFTGRDTILQNLHEALSKDSATALTQGHAISGLGGIGKTQTAVEYTYRYRSEYRFIFWTRADTEIALQAGCVDIAKLLDLPEKDATNPADTVQAVRYWLEHTVSGCSSSIMPIHLSRSKPLTRVHPKVTSCLPRERSSSIRWGLPGHLLSRKCSRKRHSVFSTHARGVPRATRQSKTRLNNWLLNLVTCPWRWSKRLPTSPRRQHVFKTISPVTGSSGWHCSTKRSPRRANTRHRWSVPGRSTSRKLSKTRLLQISYA
jgi:hypothetical protein